MPATLTTARAADAGRPLPQPPPSRPAIPLLTLLLGSAWIVASKAGVAFDPDGWWRLRTGELILDERRLPRSDVFSWTAPGRSWRLNAWLYDLIAGILGRIGGRAAVSALTAAAIVAFGVVAYALARRAGARAWPAAAVALVVTYLASPYEVERPQSLSYLLFPAALVLARSALSRSTRATLTLVALFVMWANLHLTFTAGVVLVGTVAAADVVTNRRLARPVLVVGLAAVSGLVTPYGIRAYTAALEVRDASRNIAEWQHIDPTKLPQLLVLVTLAVTVAAMIKTRRWRRLDVALPIVAFAALTIDAHRNVPFLVMLLAPELALAVPVLRPRPWLAARREPATVGLVFGLVLVVVMTGAGVEHFRPADPESYPVRSTAAIPNGCRVLNEYADGGYIIYRRWPDVLVAQDGRNDMYGIDRIEELESVLSAEGDWRAWLDGNEVDCVLASGDRRLVTELAALGWTEAARDPSGVLLLRP